METFTLESILAFFSAAAILAVLVYADQLRRPLSLLHAVVILFAVSNLLRGCILLQGETIDLWDAWMRLAMTSLRNMGMVLMVAYAMSCVNLRAGKALTWLYGAAYCLLWTATLAGYGERGERYRRNAFQRRSKGCQACLCPSGARASNRDDANRAQFKRNAYTSALSNNGVGLVSCGIALLTTCDAAIPQHWFSGRCGIAIANTVCDLYCGLGAGVGGGTIARSSEHKSRGALENIHASRQDRCEVPER